MNSQIARRPARHSAARRPVKRTGGTRQLSRRPGSTPRRRRPARRARSASPAVAVAGVVLAIGALGGQLAGAVFLVALAYLATRRVTWRALRLTVASVCLLGLWLIVRVALRRHVAAAGGAGHPLRPAEWLPLLDLAGLPVGSVPMVVPGQVL